jgi:hypothetical protein
MGSFCSGVSCCMLLCLRYGTACLELEPIMRFRDDQNFLGSVCFSNVFMRSCHVCVWRCLYAVCNFCRRVMS